MMIRTQITQAIIRISLCLTICFSFLVLHGEAQAQSVRVRSGVHDTYSRLVFDWTKKTEFNVSKAQSGVLEITFSDNAQADMSAVKLDTIRNVSNVSILSTTPLKLRIETPESSNHRSFYAGNKVVLDVYNPANGEQQTPQTIATPTPVDEETHSPPSQQELEPVTQAETSEVPEVERAPLKQYQGRGPEKPDLISVASSEAVGLAVFERGDRLWIVNDKANLLLSPQVSSQDVDFYLPMQNIDLKGGKAFVTNSRRDAYVRTQGGGLLWKIILSTKKPQAKPVEPIRRDVEAGQVRSGTVIWPFEEPGKVIDVKDPVTGLMLKVVTVKSSKDFSGPARSFVDFDVLPSSAGLVIVPKIEGMSVKVIEGTGVEISHPKGLSIVSQKEVEAKRAREQKKALADNQTAYSTRVFDFKNWQLGGEKALADNQAIMLSGANELSKTARDENHMTLARMYLANGMGAEALGFLYMIRQNNPEIARTAEFAAMRGAARALDYKSEPAFSDLSTPALDKFEEIGLWRAFVLADLGDWQQAINSLPETVAVLHDYTDNLQNKLGLVVAEVALRAGNVGMAEEVFGIVDHNETTLRAPQKAYLSYLKGEAARQDGDIDKTKEYWEPLTTGPDDLYRAKAGLALTRLLVDEEELTTDKAIDNLERLRYAWRGDELEGQINYWLGQTYFEHKDFVKGLNIMREAASFTAGTKLGERITNEMSDVFAELYLSDTLDEVSPMDAVALYEQFSELIPVGERGDKIVERLADRLAQADILDRAGNLLEYQLNHRLRGLAAYNTGTKLAAIRLLDGKADEAVQALTSAEEALDLLPDELQTRERTQTIALLRARAYSRQGRPDQAIELLENLNPNPSINRLRADIAWTAGYWDDAAEALEDVILDQNMSLTRPLSDANSTLILHRAIALNLASDRIALANMREKYSDAMAQTDKARIFDVITRPRQNAALADRDTLMGIVSEVDLFEEFLESYKDVASPSN